MNLKPNNTNVLTAFVLALFNYGMFYAIGVILARSLGPTGYDDYQVAVAVVSLMATITTLGFEKFALQMLPSAYERSDWSGAHGFWQYCFRRVFVLSALVTVFIFINHSIINQFTGGRDHPLMLMMTYFPGIALSTFLIEVLAANAWATFATFVYRFGLPAVTLGLVLVVEYSPYQLNEEWTVYAYGTSWMLVLVVTYFAAQRVTPAEMWQAKPAMHNSQWFAESVPYMLNGMLLSLLAHSGLLILEVTDQPETEVGIFAAAMQTAVFVVLLSTSTNRFYLPHAAVLIEARRFGELRRFMARRRNLIGGVAGSFCAIVLLFGHRILGVFGEAFEVGYPVLCVIAVTTMFSTTFALSPYLLQFLGRSRMVVVARVISAIVNGILSIVLGMKFGATGVAVAYAISLGGFTLFAQQMAQRVIKTRVKQSVTGS